MSDALDGGGLVTVASGDADKGGVTIPQRDAELFAGRLSADVAVEVPGEPHVHVFVAVGCADLDGAGALAVGDAVRLTDEGPHTLTAGDEGCEVLVWATA